MALVKKSRAEVFEKRKSIVMAIFKQDAAERSRRIVAMKDKSCDQKSSSTEQSAHRLRTH